MDVGTIITFTILGFSLLCIIILILTNIFTVKQQTILVIERLGKYQRMVKPGLHVKMPFIDSKAGVIDLRQREATITGDTKTKDNVFIQTKLSIQYFVKQGEEYNAFYKLSNPLHQIESYVLNLIRSEIPKLTLDEVFIEKDQIANAIQQHLDPTMEEFGYVVKQALITDIVVEKKVAEAMNEINAQQRLREAANAKGDAEKILVVKRAEAEAESKKLQGEGIANQRKAIIEGLKGSVKEFQEAIEGTSAQDVMNLILMTQYFDMMKSVGESANSSTILLPHSPSYVNDLRNQITEAVMIGKSITPNQDHDKKKV